MKKLIILISVSISLTTSAQKWSTETELGLRTSFESFMVEDLTLIDSRTVTGREWVVEYIWFMPSAGHYVYFELDEKQFKSFGVEQQYSLAEIILSRKHRSANNESFEYALGVKAGTSRGALNGMVLRVTPSLSYDTKWIGGHVNASFGSSVLREAQNAGAPWPGHLLTNFRFGFTLRVLPEKIAGMEFILHRDQLMQPSDVSVGIRTGFGLKHGPNLRLGFDLGHRGKGYYSRLQVPLGRAISMEIGGSLRHSYLRRGTWTTQERNGALWSSDEPSRRKSPMFYGELQLNWQLPFAKGR